MSKPQTWFATSRFGNDLAHATSGSVDPSLQLIHAKKLGTMLSACGQETTSWIKHWEPFRAVSDSRSCAACVRAITDEQINRTSVTSSRSTMHTA